jgi:hypothetical protein
MLKVQEYLPGGKTHQHLRDELGVRTVRHTARPRPSTTSAASGAPRPS